MRANYWESITKGFDDLSSTQNFYEEDFTQVNDGDKAFYEIKCDSCSFFTYILKLILKFN